MTRARQRSERQQQQIASLRASQAQSATAISTASTAATQADAAVVLQANIDAIDAGTINATLDDLDTRLSALETP